MAYQATETLYTDVNPLGGAGGGKVLKEGDENARFLLVAEGGVLSDDDAKKYGLEGNKSLKSYDEITARKTREEEVIAHNDAIVASGGISTSVDGGELVTPEQRDAQKASAESPVGVSADGTPKAEAKAKTR